MLSSATKVYFSYTEKKSRGATRETVWPWIALSDRSDRNNVSPSRLRLNASPVEHDYDREEEKFGLQVEEI